MSFENIMLSQKKPVSKGHIFIGFHLYEIPSAGKSTDSEVNYELIEGSEDDF